VCRGLLGLTYGRLGARVQLALFKSRLGAEERHCASYRVERMPLTAAMDAPPGGGASAGPLAGTVLADVGSAGDRARLARLWL
jgi:hypothetical protein